MACWLRLRDDCRCLYVGPWSEAANHGTVRLEFQTSAAMTISSELQRISWLYASTILIADREPQQSQ